MSASAPSSEFMMSLRQLKLFKVAEGQAPSTLLADGGKYYGDVGPSKLPHGRGLAILGDGTRYAGDWDEGQYHGKGVMSTASFEYEGDWEHDKMHGVGTIHYKDSIVNLVMRGISMLSPFEAEHKPLEYRGDLHRTHHRHGKGVMTYRNGDVYDGEWVSNRRSGQGTMRYANGEKYVGIWLNDEKDGQGCITYPNGSVFTGQLSHDKRQGDGILIVTCGDEYHGEFSNNEMTGKGEMRYKNGDSYQGEWKDGVRHGYGQFRLEKRGATITGTFHKGLVHGEATVEFPSKSTFVGLFNNGERASGTIFYHNDHSCYQGEWRGDHMHGKGLMWGGDGEFYYGAWTSSKRDGVGHVNYPDGSEYAGEFKEDKRVGKGILQSADGTILCGVWVNGSMTTGYQGEWDGRAFNGIGTLTAANGDTYLGLFQNGLRHGFGILRTNTKHTLEGFWSQDVAEGQGTLKLPGGEFYVGPFRGGVRSGTQGYVRDSIGSVYFGEWQHDAQCGTGAFFLKNINDPILRDDVTDTADHKQDKLVAARTSPIPATTPTPVADASGLGSLFGLFRVFRSRSNSNKESESGAAMQSYIVGFPDYGVLVGPWACEKESASVLRAGTPVPPLVGGGSASGNASLSSPPALPTLLRTRGKLAGKAIMFFAKGGRIFQGSWSENTLKLELPHRRGVIAAVDSQGTQQSPGCCTFCKKSYHVFKKETACDLCGRSSCYACLSDMNVKENVAIAALVAQCRSTAIAASTAPLPAQTPTADNVGAHASACKDCFEASQLATTYGTLWSPLHSNPNLSLDDLQRGDAFLDQKNWLTYRGFFAGCDPHGTGTLWTGTSSCYHGDFRLGKRHGYGSVVHSNGEEFVGSWVNDTATGHGTYRSSNGTAFQGEWRQGLLDKLVYEGEVNADLQPHGIGRMFHDDDHSVYNGDFSSGLRHGTGTLHSADGHDYCGQFQQNRMEGLGRMVLPDSVFVGMFLDGSRHGKGVEKFATNIVEGVWHFGVLEGCVRSYAQKDEGRGGSESSSSSSVGDIVDTLYRNGKERCDVFVPQIMASDDLSLHCSACHTPFTFFLRKHHCRLCGKVFCDRCCNRKLPLPEHFRIEGMQRLCMECFINLSEGSSLAIHRYPNGSVYAGLWCGKKWRGKGIFRRPSGDCVVLNSPDSASAAVVVQSPLPATGGSFPSPPKGDQDISNSSLPASTQQEIDTFSMWWLSLLSATHSDLPLDLRPISEFAIPDTTMHDVEIHQFNEGGADAAAAQRQARFFPAVLPTPPVPPLHLIPKRPPEPHLSTDEAQLEQVKRSRLALFPDTVTTAASERDHASQSSSLDPSGSGGIVLRSHQRQKINIETPKPPADGTNMRVPWEAWECAPPPSYRGITGTAVDDLSVCTAVVLPQVGAMDRAAMRELEGPLVISVNVDRITGAVRLTQSAATAMESAPQRLGPARSLNDPAAASTAPPTVALEVRPPPAAPVRQQSTPLTAEDSNLHYSF